MKKEELRDVAIQFFVMGLVVASLWYLLTR